MKKALFSLFFLLITSGCSNYQTHYAVVQEGDKDGLLHESGYIVIKPIYNHITNFTGDEAVYEHMHPINLHWIHNRGSKAYAIVVNSNEKYGAVDINGKLLLKPIYDSITYFFNGYARVEVGGKFGLINENFEVVLKPTYDYIQEFVGDIAILESNNKYGCINKNMELKIKPSYDRIYFQQEKFLRTQIEGKWGYLDHQCNILAKPIFDYAYDFSNGYAKVLLDDKIGYLSPNGELITKPIFTKESASF